MPASGLIKPVSNPKRVDFPLPLGPMSAIVSPGDMVRVTPSTARSLPYDLNTESSRNMSGSKARLFASIGREGTPSRHQRHCTLVLLGGSQYLSPIALSHGSS